jgi:isoquinoline 1-oxidoreductase alpha subunit
MLSVKQVKTPGGDQPGYIAKGTRMTTTINVNGSDRAIDVDEDMPLLWVIRDVLGMTGTKFGCGAGLCGACTVHIDGEAQFACQTPVSTVGAAKVTTIEAMQHSPVAQAVQQAWVEADVVQCGYCQPGQVMRATALLSSTPQPTDAQIDAVMYANLCRCGCYPRIRAAIHRAAGMKVSA